MAGDYESGEMHRPLDEMLYMAKEDIAALLWLSGDCRFCKYGKKQEYHGASRWICGREKGAADCKPKWRYDNGT